MNARLARSIEIIEFACIHFADSAGGLVPWAEEERDAARAACNTDAAYGWVLVAKRLACAAEHLDAAAALLKNAREGA